MMTDRSHMQLIEGSYYFIPCIQILITPGVLDHVQSNVIKSSRRRHNPSLSKPRFKNITHATIRSKSNTHSTDTKGFHQHDNLHSVNFL